MGATLCLYENEACSTALKHGVHAGEISGLSANSQDYAATHEVWYQPLFSMALIYFNPTQRQWCPVNMQTSLLTVSRHTCRRHSALAHGGSAETNLLRGVEVGDVSN